jgi:hypothetical protein
MCREIERFIQLMFYVARVAKIASLGACVLVYTGVSLSIRRLAARLKSKRRDILSDRKAYAEQSVV